MFVNSRFEKSIKNKVNETELKKLKTTSVNGVRKNLLQGIL